MIDCCPFVGASWELFIPIAVCAMLPLVVASTFGGVGIKRKSLLTSLVHYVYLLFI
jgi:hypothetical protein